MASEFVEILNAGWHHQQDVLGAAHKIATRLSPAALTQPITDEIEAGRREYERFAWGDAPNELRDALRKVADQ